MRALKQILKKKLLASFCENDKKVPVRISWMQRSIDIQNFVELYLISESNQGFNKKDRINIIGISSLSCEMINSLKTYCPLVRTIKVL